MDRRSFFAIATLGASFKTASFSFAQTPAAAMADVEMISDLPPLPSDLADKGSSPPASYSPVAPVGTAPPSKEEMQVAYQLLMMSPYDTSPIDVAQYFLAVGSGAYGTTLRQYAREWPIRANPVIYHFFSSTLTKPEGDATAWCAAFLNWCLLRARATSPDTIGKSQGDYSISGKPFPDSIIQTHSTNSASSGSFRCWDQSQSPKRGEIAVFKDAGTDGMTAACRGTGHVAFFLGVPRDGVVRVLGGNQTQAGSGGAVTVADMKSGSGSRFMKIVSLR